MPLWCGEVCRCSAHHVVDIISLYFHLLALDKKNTNHRHRYPSKCIQPFQTCSKDIQLLWRLHIIIIRWKMEDLIGEVQHISSCILLRNQQPTRLHQNFILTNQIQIKKQADWLLSLSYHTNICLSSFVPFYPCPPRSVPTPFERNSPTYFCLNVLKITICHHTHHTNHNKKSQNLPICLNQ